MSLIEEIEENKRKISTDAYPMSIGEVINLYRDGEIDIHPEFQRVYRWDEYQKSSLIESVLMGIPLPSFFVSQREDGIWDLVDGLQRLATILSFTGEYKNENDEPLTPLVLEKTKYIPDLDGTVWKSEFGDKALPIEIQRDFKRYKIDFKIIKKESDDNAKYDLFQRLNTGGSSLEGQEVRNCLLIMVNKGAYDFIERLSENKDFIACTPITERQENERYRYELILRFFVYKNMIETEIIIDYGNVDSFLSEQMVNIFKTGSDFDYEESESLFNEVFSQLNQMYGEDSFKAYRDGAFKGAFVLSRFEWICSYILSRKIKGLDAYSEIREVVNSLGEDKDYINSTKRGTGSLRRTKQLINIASSK